MHHHKGNGFLDIYRGEDVSSGMVEDAVARERDAYLADLDRSLGEGPDSDRLGPVLKGSLGSVCDSVLPHFAKADLLAIRYQDSFRRASITIFCLAALAVMVVSAQYIFRLSHHLILGEVAAMIAVVAIISYGNHVGFHRRWVDYRLMAERLRVAVYISFLGEEPADSLRENWLCRLVEGSWCVKCCREIWGERQGEDPLPEEALPVLKRFVEIGWLDRQRRHHLKKSERAYRTHGRISTAGITFFVLTLAAAILHYLHMGGELGGKVLIFLAIALPVGGSALGTFRSHFEYKKIGERSRIMAHSLGLLLEKLKSVDEMKGLKALVREAESLMLQENTHWHITLGARDIEMSGLA